jgi:hypothetical protein
MLPVNTRKVNETSRMNQTEIGLKPYCYAYLRELSREPLIEPIMNRVADKNGMIARRATLVVVILRCQGAQHSERPFLSQPLRALALRAVCGVRLLAKGITIRVVAFLASHPAKPGARPCWTQSEVP